MPPRKQSHATQVVKRACEVEDPLTALPSHLLTWSLLQEQAVSSPLKPLNPLRSQQEPETDVCVQDQSSQQHSVARVKSGVLQQPALTQDACRAEHKDCPDPAREAGQPLISLPASCALQPDALVVRFQHHTSKQLDRRLLDWALALVRDTMRPLYEQVWGWSDQKKVRQLLAAASRFIVATVAHPDSQGGQPAAFVNFRFERYEGRPTCYLYEVMVDRWYRRRGMGQYIMGLVEQMAWAHGMERCMLTSFTANVAADKFYRRLGYLPDELTPEEPCGYVIFGKPRP